MSVASTRQKRESHWWLFTQDGRQGIELTPTYRADGLVLLAPRVIQEANARSIHGKMLVLDRMFDCKVVPLHDKQMAASFIGRWQLVLVSDDETHRLDTFNAVANALDDGSTDVFVVAPDVVCLLAMSFSLDDATSKGASQLHKMETELVFDGMNVDDDDDDDDNYEVAKVVALAEAWPFPRAVSLVITVHANWIGSVATRMLTHYSNVGSASLASVIKEHMTTLQRHFIDAALDATYEATIDTHLATIGRRRGGSGGLRARGRRIKRRFKRSANKWTGGKRTKKGAGSKGAKKGAGASKDTTKKPSSNKGAKKSSGAKDTKKKNKKKKSSSSTAASSSSSGGGAKKPKKPKATDSTSASGAGGASGGGSSGSKKPKKPKATDSTSASSGTGGGKKPKATDSTSTSSGTGSGKKPKATDSSSGTGSGKKPKATDSSSGSGSGKKPKTTDSSSGSGSANKTGGSTSTSSSGQKKKKKKKEEDQKKKKKKKDKPSDDSGGGGGGGGGGGSISADGSVTGSVGAGDQGGGNSPPSANDQAGGASGGGGGQPPSDGGQQPPFGGGGGGGFGGAQGGPGYMGGPGYAGDGEEGNGSGEGKGQQQQQQQQQQTNVLILGGGSGDSTGANKKNKTASDDDDDDGEETPSDNDREEEGADTVKSSIYGLLHSWNTQRVAGHMTFSVCFEDSDSATDTDTDTDTDSDSDSDDEDSDSDLETTTCVPVAKPSLPTTAAAAATSVDDDDDDDAVMIEKSMIRSIARMGVFNALMKMGLLEPQGNGVSRTPFGGGGRIPACLERFIEGRLSVEEEAEEDDNDHARSTMHIDDAHRVWDDIRKATATYAMTGFQ